MNSNILQFGDMDVMDKSKTDLDLIAAIHSRRIYSNQNIIPPSPLFCIGSSEIMSLGDFSLIKGKAKSRKTFLMSILASAILAKREMFGITPIFQEAKRRVIWCDTEQNPYHTQKAILRGTELAFVDQHEDIEVYTMRDKQPIERKKMISYLIDESNTEEDIAIVIIDGIKDLVTSINDEDQATELTTWLLDITTKKNLHIITVIHENKSANDKTARGHLGAELTNKTQCVITLERDKDDKEISIVKCEQIRGAREFNPIGFKINDKGLPYPIEVKADAETTRKPKFTPTSYEYDFHKILVNKIFKVNTSGLSYTELWKAIQLEIEILDPQRRPGDNAAKSIASYWGHQDLIKHNGEQRNKAKWLKSIDNSGGLEV